MRSPHALIDAREAALRLGVAHRTLYGWVQRGVLRAFRDPVSRRVWVVEADVEALRLERRLIPIGPARRPETDPIEPADERL